MQKEVERRLDDILMHQKVAVDGERVSITRVFDGAFVVILHHSGNPENRVTCVGNYPEFVRNAYVSRTGKGDDFTCLVRLHAPSIVMEHRGLSAHAFVCVLDEFFDAVRERVRRRNEAWSCLLRSEVESVPVPILTFS